MTMVHFTADTHFGHRAMTEQGWRPQFWSVDHMNQSLIDNWNDVVRPADTVWHLGDFGLGSRDAFMSVLPHLHGTKYLIAGNHDQVWAGHRDAYRHRDLWRQAGFTEICDFARRRIGGHQVLLSHFPYFASGDHTAHERYGDYRLHDTGLWLLHGHVHTAWKQKGRQINVGVDVNDFAPVSMNTIRDLIIEHEEPDMTPTPAAPGATT